MKSHSKINYPYPLDDSCILTYKRIIQHYCWGIILMGIMTKVPKV